MTLSDLQNDISVLGDGQTISNSALLIVSLNRALRKLYTDRRIEKSVRIASRTLTPTSYRKEIRCKSGMTIELPLKGIAYSMRIHGTGNYMIKDGEAIKTYSVSSMNEAKLITGFLGFGGKITFWSSFSFTVYDLAVYDEMYSQYTYDIPDCGPRTVFDMRDLYGDFMCFTAPATDRYGRQLKNCRLYDGKVEVDSSYSGEIMLTYRRLPTEIVSDQLTQVIDVPNEYTHLLSALVASYYWYHTDEALAKYYYNQYEDGIKSLMEHSYEHIDLAYLNTNGWA